MAPKAKLVALEKAEGPGAAPPNEDEGAAKFGPGVKFEGPGVEIEVDVAPFGSAVPSAGLLNTAERLAKGLGRFGCGAGSPPWDGGRTGLMPRPRVADPRDGGLKLGLEAPEEGKANGLGRFRALSGLLDGV